MSKKTNETIESSIVGGAGICGMIYALRNHIDAIYEKHDKTGGKIYTCYQNGVMYDLGYAWFYEREKTMMKYVSDYCDIIDFPCQSAEYFIKDIIDELYEFKDFTHEYSTFSEFAQTKIGTYGYECIKNHTTLPMNEDPHNILQTLYYRASKRKTVKGGMQEFVNALEKDCINKGISIYINTEAPQNSIYMISSSKAMCSIVVRFIEEPFTNCEEVLPSNDGFNRITPIDNNMCVLYSSKPWTIIDTEDELKDIIHGVLMDCYPQKVFRFDTVFSPHICFWDKQEGWYNETYSFEDSIKNKAI